MSEQDKNELIKSLMRLRKRCCGGVSAACMTTNSRTAKDNAEFQKLIDGVKALIVERDEARREVCGFHHLTGFLSGDYAISRGWDCYKNYLGEGFPQSVKDFKEFLNAHSEEDRKTIERLQEENRQLRELKMRGVVSEPVKAKPPHYEYLQDLG